MIKFNKLLVYPVLSLGCLMMLASGCKKDDDKSADSISDYNFYMMLGTSLINCYTDIYNQNLAGMPTGGQNITTDGPMGGTVVITGTTTYDDTHGITTTDLILSMTAVQYVYSYTESNGKAWTTQLTLTGATTYAGSFSNGYTSVNHLSDNLQISGTVSCDGISRGINAMGQVSINRSNSTSVNIFGHTASW
jgi:hypothetical protein